MITQPILEQISVTLKDFVPHGGRQFTIYIEGGMMNVSERLYRQIKDFAAHHGMTLNAVARQLCDEINSK